MANHKGGVIDDAATYTQNTLAEILGRTPEWVVEHVVDGGCWAKRLGNIYLISGQSFRLWCENRQETGTNSDRRKRSRGRETVGGEA